MKAGCLVGLALAAVSLSGCGTAVWINQPKAGPLTEAVYDFGAGFHQDFQPGTFTATLIGGGTSQDYRAFFAPAPAPGGASTALAPAPSFKTGAYELDVSGAFNRPQRLFEGLGQGVQFTPPVPGLTGAALTSGVVCVKANAPAVPMTVVAASAPPRAVTVTLTPSSTSWVSLNGNPMGAPATLTILSGQTTASFTIFADVSGFGPFVIRVSVPGHQERQLYGKVFMATCVP